VLGSPSQVMARPRAQTADCLCADSVFLDVYRDRVAQPGQLLERASVEPDR
jgi:hypothetical protein